MEVMVVEVWRAGGIASPWLVAAFLQPIPPSAANTAGVPGLTNDWDGAAYEPTGNLTVIPGDEIRVMARNGGLTAGNVAVSVGVIFSSNTGGTTVQSGPVDYIPK
jgi:hypothetical protein